MILKASQRAGALQLANHLLNERDNDHVTVLEVRGFMADDLHGAFQEARAIARGTQCKQYLFSLSLNPPKGANAKEEDFERAADEAEQRLGLTGQPRAIVLHEKEGRRHAHVVWSRIDAAQMKAINMAHFKRKLTTLSKELYLEHGWSLPEGLRLNGGKSPLNYTLAEWQQAKRLGLDPREIKDAFREAWKQSDNLKAFAAALEERGYFLAKGDRRGFVAIDIHGEVYSVPRYLNVKTANVRRQLGDGEALLAVDEVRADIAARVSQKLKEFVRETRDAQAAELRPLNLRNEQLRHEHRDQRDRLNTLQAGRHRVENDARAARLRKGLAGLWDTISGKAAAIKKQNAMEAYEHALRDRKQRDQLVFDQRHERAALQERIDKMRLRHVQERKTLHKDLMAHLRDQTKGGKDFSPPSQRREFKSGFSLDR